MSEKLNTKSPETIPENSERLEKSKRSEQIRSLEAKGKLEEIEQKEDLKEARHDAQELAKSKGEMPKPGVEKEGHVFVAGEKTQNKKLTFKRTMQHTQAKLPPASRTFSKVIHQPVIEKASDIASQTIFRPSLTLGASLGALIGGSIFYGFARYFGFNLSGSEFVVCAVIGAILGLVWEFGGFLAKKLLHKKTT